MTFALQCTALHCSLEVRPLLPGRRRRYPLLMFEAREESVVGGVRHALLDAGVPLSYCQVLRRWQDDPEFTRQFTALLAAAPYPAYFFETPPIDRESGERDFEFVLIESDSLGRVQPDPSPFSAHFSRRIESATVVEFPNLAGDAQLIVPTPEAADSTYSHLASFVRKAPAGQIDELWRLVGASMETRIDSNPLWLSTSGLGGAWVHIRLDRTPKYYQYAPYRTSR